MTVSHHTSDIPRVYPKARKHGVPLLWTPLPLIPTGSGGNNHAVDHYEALKYPLAVKLGTITPDGADVYSYYEDEMVDDPKLAEHLEHFGINMMRMTKVVN